MEGQGEGVAGTSGYRMGGVVAYLEEHWYQCQDERSRWETERKDLYHQIDLLERKSRCLEDLQHHLLRRIQMLNYALDQERAKNSGRLGQPHTQPATPDPALDIKDLPKPVVPQRKSKGILETYIRDFDAKTAALLVDLGRGSHGVAEKKKDTISPSDDPSSFIGQLARTSGLGNARSSLPLAATNVKAEVVKDSIVPSPDASQPPNPSYSTVRMQTPNQKKNLAEAALRLRGKATSRDKSGDYKEAVANEKSDSLDAFEQPENKSKENGEKEPTTDKRNARRKDDTPKKEVKENIQAAITASELKGSESLGDLGELEQELSPATVLTSEPIASLKRAAKSWQPFLSLRHHLDVVRSVSFHETEPIMISGSDDFTVKIWDWKQAGTVGFNQQLTADVEPIHTYLGHTGPIFSVLYASDRARCFSAGADKVIRMWKVPPLESLSAYATRGKAVVYDAAVLKGHTNAIWDLAKHPQRPLLFSASSDTTINTWNFDEDQGSLVSSMSHPACTGFAVDYIPTSVSPLYTDANKIVAGYRNSELVVFDVETNVALSKLASSSSQSLDAQINKICSHPLMPLVVSAHEDKTIKFWDIKSGTCVHSMIAHQTPVSTLTVDPSGSYLLTAGGCSLRFWEIGTKNCVQEIHAHRQKYDEGILCVMYHPTIDLIASGGADATIKLHA